MYKTAILNEISGKKQNNDGFTLIEALLAMGIVAICLLSISRVQIAAMNGTTTAKMSSQAGAFASDQVERLLSLNFTDAALADGTTAQRQEGGYSIVWSVQDDPGGTGNLNIKLITVTANNPNMGRKSVTLRTIKSRSI